MHPVTSICMSLCLSVCVSVCVALIIETFDLESSFLVCKKKRKKCTRVCVSILFPGGLKGSLVFGLQIHLQNLETKFICQGHQVEVKVTGAKKVQNLIRLSLL